MAFDGHIIRLEKVSRIYRQGDQAIRALDRVNLRVRQGEFVAVAGPSGSGKTTLLNVTAGLDRPNEGGVWLKDQPLNQLSRRRLAQLRLREVGFIFQAYNLVPVLSAAENAEFILLLRGVPARERRRRIQALLKEVGLEGLEDRRPAQLSGGQQQRVAVARAIAAEPSLVLADEPTANLDTQTAMSLLDLMERLNREHRCTFLFSTHDSRVLERAHRVVRMLDGRIAADESRDVSMSREGGRAARAWLRALLLILCAPNAGAQQFEWGGSIRGYQFLRVAGPDVPTRRDTELGAFRLTSNLGLSANLQLQAHGLLTGLSPPLSGAALVAASTPSLYLPLQKSLGENETADLAASFDRLALQIQGRGARLLVGRQAITWGVNYFWPALDLFAPFAPQQIDRDYKPGVDAVRLTVPLTPYSELEVIGASLGPSPSVDWAAGALARFHLGRADLGLMSGKFHRDTVGGAFVTADVRGTGVRAEATWTDSGDREDRARDRERFWRGSVGIDRQLTPYWTLTAELSWNGYGARSPSEHASLISADRILRGEVNTLGRVYAGLSAGWQIHPLWRLSSTVLVNAEDPSALWIPSLTWSSSNNSELLLGAQIPAGEGPGGNTLPRSEYGSLPTTLFAGLKLYF